jgi:hypothetical protein
MSTPAIDVLKASLKTEQSTLATMRDETKREREHGERLQREVDAQSRIVADIASSIATLEAALQAEMRVVTE